jgi:hypothetical protein
VLTVVNADGSTENGSLIDEIVRERARRMLAAALDAELNSCLVELVDARDEAGPSPGRAQRLPLAAADRDQRRCGRGQGPARE